MESRRWIIIGLIVIVVAVGIVWYVRQQAGAPGGPAGPAAPAAGTTGGGGVSPTRKEAPANVAVPEPGAASQGEVAVPTISVPAAPGGTVDTKFRSFDIVASGGKYSPSTIIVRRGDIVHINFKAQDGTYDIMFPDYGLWQQAKTGEAKVIEFQAVTDGEFAFRCEKSCPKGPMSGTLIVAKQ